MSVPFRVSQDWLDSIIYLYPDQASAERGDEVGGTGFLLGWRIDDTTNFTLWAVTNRHVIEQGNWTIRLNGVPTGLAYQDTTEQEWFFADGHDLAVRPLAVSDDIHRTKFVTDEWLLSKDWLEALDIGPGDSCVSVGRFVGHAGKTLNNPVVRFGQISQNPKEPIVIAGREEECFLVESRSIGGYSGSPVMVHLDTQFYRPSINLRKAPDGTVLGQGRFPSGPWILGVNFAMVPLWERVRDVSGMELNSGFRVPMNTGIMAVVPAWHLYELLANGPASGPRKNIEMAIKIHEQREAALPVAIPTGDEASSHGL